MVLFYNSISQTPGTIVGTIIRFMSMAIFHENLDFQEIYIYDVTVVLLFGC